MRALQISLFDPPSVIAPGSIVRQEYPEVIYVS